MYSRLKDYLLPLYQLVLQDCRILVSTANIWPVKKKPGHLKTVKFSAESKCCCCLAWCPCLHWYGYSSSSLACCSCVLLSYHLNSPCMALAWWIYFRLAEKRRKGSFCQVWAVSCSFTKFLVACCVLQVYLWAYGGSERRVLSVHREGRMVGTGKSVLTDYFLF